MTPPSTLLWPEEDRPLVLSSQDVKKTTGKAAGASSSDFSTWNHRRSKETTRKSNYSGFYESLGSGNVPKSSTIKPARSNAIDNQIISNVSALWSDKYSPTCIADLCVAPQKIKLLQKWIKDFMGAHTAVNTNYYNNSIVKRNTVPKLCVLVGGPGIGKSTMVRVIAKEMNLSVLEWNDTCGTYGRLRTHSASMFHQSVNDESHVSFRQNGNPSSMDLLEEFLNSVALPYQSVVEYTWGEDSSSTKFASTTATATANVGSIVLLDDLPNMYNQPMIQERFR